MLMLPLLMSMLMWSCNEPFRNLRMSVWSVPGFRTQASLYLSKTRSKSTGGRDCCGRQCEEEESRRVARRENENQQQSCSQQRRVS